MIDTQNILVRAFRSVDNPAGCLGFLKGHAAVLEQFKIAHITSNSINWTRNPSTIVFIIESLDTGKLLGGGRLQVFDYQLSLPIEDAIGYMDEKVYPMVNEWAQEGVAEFCGLWNTRKAVKIGLNSSFIIRVGFAIAEQLKLKHIVGLAAPSTVRPSLRAGFEIEESLGNKGSFYYPKVDLTAIVFHLKDVLRLSKALLVERENIFELREKLNFLRKENLKHSICNVQYELEIPNLEKTSFYHLDILKKHEFIQNR